MFMAKIKIDTYFAICIGFFLLFKEVFFHSYQFPDPNYFAGSGSKQTIQSSYSFYHFQPVDCTENDNIWIVLHFCFKF